MAEAPLAGPARRGNGASALEARRLSLIYIASSNLPPPDTRPVASGGCRWMSTAGKVFSGGAHSHISHRNKETLTRLAQTPRLGCLWLGSCSPAGSRLPAWPAACSTIRFLTAAHGAQQPQSFLPSCGRKSGATKSLGLEWLSRKSCTECHTGAR